MLSKDLRFLNFLVGSSSASMLLLLEGDEGMLPPGESNEDLLLSGAFRLKVWILSKELSASATLPPAKLPSLFSLRWNLRLETFDLYLKSLVFK